MCSHSSSTLQSNFACAGLLTKTMFTTAKGNSLLLHSKPSCKKCQSNILCAFCLSRVNSVNELEEEVERHDLALRYNLLLGSDKLHRKVHSVHYLSLLHQHHCNFFCPAPPLLSSPLSAPPSPLFVPPPPNTHIPFCNGVLQTQNLRFPLLRFQSYEKFSLLPT